MPCLHLAVATAALLGEAIGRLKQTGDPSDPDDPTSRAAPELDELDDIVIVADAGIDAAAHLATSAVCAAAIVSASVIDRATVFCIVLS